MRFGQLGALLRAWRGARHGLSHTSKVAPMTAFGHVFATLTRGWEGGWNQYPQPEVQNRWSREEMAPFRDGEHFRRGGSDLGKCWNFRSILAPSVRSSNTTTSCVSQSSQNRGKISSSPQWWFFCQFFHHFGGRLLWFPPPPEPPVSVAKTWRPAGSRDKFLPRLRGAQEGVGTSWQPAHTWGVQSQIMPSDAPVGNPNSFRTEPHIKIFNWFPRVLKFLPSFCHAYARPQVLSVSFQSSRPFGARKETPPPQIVRQKVIAEHTFLWNHYKKN